MEVVSESDLTELMTIFILTLTGEMSGSKMNLKASGLGLRKSIHHAAEDSLSALGWATAL